MITNGRKRTGPGTARLAPNHTLSPATHPVLNAA
jgi:hypothetical protein